MNVYTVYTLLNALYITRNPYWTETHTGQKPMLVDSGDKQILNYKNTLSLLYNI